MEYGVDPGDYPLPAAFFEVPSSAVDRTKISDYLKSRLIFESSRNSLWIPVQFIRLMQKDAWMDEQNIGWFQKLLKNTRKTWTYTYKNFTLNMGQKPLLMGIVNVTPDSFSDGGRYFKADRAVNHVEEMVASGVDMVDIGAESSRPGAEQVDEKEEWRRLKPVLEQLKEKGLMEKTIISVDTYKAEIARKSLEMGVQIINDISAGNMDPEMPDVVAEYNCPYIMMHMQGTPADMQKNPHYEHLMDEILDFFDQKINQALKKGIRQIILDPGIGFGKRVEDNYEIIRRLPELKQLGFPVLLGASRKSFLWRKLKIEPKDADNSTIVANSLGVLNGADILRIHHVSNHTELVNVIQWIQYNKAGIAEN
ncbi:MAG: hypothetical protein Kow00108_26950 [Calditrichia bacterium]